MQLRALVAVTCAAAAAAAAARGGARQPPGVGACHQDDIALVQLGVELHRGREQPLRRGDLSSGPPAERQKEAWPYGDAGDVHSLGEHGRRNATRVATPAPPAAANSGAGPPSGPLSRLCYYVSHLLPTAPLTLTPIADRFSGFFARLGALGLSGAFGRTVTFPEDDEGTGTLLNNESYGLDDGRSSRLLATRHKASTAWVMVRPRSYCSENRMALSRPGKSTSMAACYELAAADRGCGDTLYGNGETDCYCVTAGSECIPSPSTRGNSVFRLASSVQRSKDAESSRRFHFWRARSARAQPSNSSAGSRPRPAKNAPPDDQQLQEEAPQVVKMIAFTPDLTYRLKVMSIVVFLTVLIVMTTWFVSAVVEK